MELPTSLPFSDLPPAAGGISKLFLDYLLEFQKVQSYFASDFRSLQNVSKSIERLRERYPHRPLLVEVLLEQNRGASPQTLANISLLGDPSTFAVVTGQQVGILGGPLYTIYKAITAVKLASRLSATFPDCKFVPVFWLEGEDHDFEEVNGIGLLNPDSVPVRVDYLVDGKAEQKIAGPIGEILLDESVQDFFERLGRTLANTEFKASTLEVARGAYASGATLNRAFSTFIGKFFESEGLIFISSNDARLKRILSPVFEKEIREFPRVSQLIIERSAELEERRYHAQIKTKALNLFHFFKGGRYFIEPREHDFSLKGTRHFMTREELLRIAAENPEQLSPNVALRPVCQDTLLPTAVYVAGPSEIAYFAQLKGVYDYFGLSMPVIYPRASATIVEGRVDRILEKYQLGIADVFANPQKVRDSVIAQVSEIKIDEMFTAAARRLEDQMKELQFGLNYIDSTLLGALETARSKMEYQLQMLKEKTLEAQARKHETALRQVEKVSNSLFPNHNFQEREIGIVHFMNRHGADFPRWLMSELAIDRFEHQILRI